MASSMHMFAKLGIGVKFNAKRFKKDAERFQMTNSPDVPPEQSPLQEKSQDSESATTQSYTTAKNKKKRKRDEDDGSGDTVDESLDVFGRDDNGKERKRGKEHSEISRKLEIDGEHEEQIRREKITAFRRKKKIHVHGTDIPDPIASFQQLQQEYSVHPTLLKNIDSVGYQSPTPIQMQAIPLMLHRREILACAPTGSGKTAAFILPVLCHLKEPKRKGFRAIVLAPTRELAQQTYREFCRLAEGTGLKIHMINKASKAIQKFSNKTSQKFDILVSTPNRVVYMLNQDPPAIQLHNVEWLVIDESDKLFEEGKQGFREQLAAIYKACDSSQVRRAMFSATYGYDVEQWCQLNLDNVASVIVGQRNSAVETVQQELLFVGQEYGKLLAVREIIQKGVQPPVLVFVQSKDRAKELFHELLYDSINVDVIHADRTQQERDNIVQSFRAGKIWVLICTELMGRGIDFKGVNLVINYDFPSSAVSYIHRIGRTGRAGRPGRAITLFTHTDLKNLRSIAGVMKEAGCPVPDYMLQLKKPSKKSKTEMEKHQVKRESIRTVPKDILAKAKKKRSYLKATKEGLQS